MIYQSFAQVYDTLMDDSLYPQWRDYVTARVAPKQQNLLELAGGSGSLALLLAEAGYQVTNFDFSSDMLALASAKGVENAGVRLLEGDMRDLSDIGRYDIVTCFDDSICYMPDLETVTQVFQRVASVLPAGGHFMFDAHSLYQMDEVFPDYMFNYRTEDYAFMWSSEPGEQPHSIEHDLTFFVYDEAIDAYHPLNELHEERTYPVTAYVTALESVGFRDVEVTADFGRSIVSETSTRWFFSAVKA